MDKATKHFLYVEKPSLYLLFDLRKNDGDNDKGRKENMIFGSIISHIA